MKTNNSQTVYIEYPEKVNELFMQNGTGDPPDPPPDDGSTDPPEDEPDDPPEGDPP